MSEPLVIRCRENGPLVIEGAVIVTDHQGNPFPPIPASDEGVSIIPSVGAVN